MTTLVLLPGMDGTGKLFGPLIAALSPRFNVIVVRYPASVPLAYEALVELARTELPADEDFVILGESFSGPVAVSLAAQAAPNLRGVILCASFVRCPLAWPALLKPLAHLLPLGSIPAGVLSVPLLGRYGNSRSRRLLGSALAMVQADVLRARIRSVLTVDVREAAAAIKVPFLYLQASAHWIVPKSAAIAIRKLVPALQVMELSGPHMLLQISPTAAARAIEAFVELALLQKSKALELESTMHPAAQRYFDMDLDNQKKVQILLCQHALDAWEGLVPANLGYRESVAGSAQVFDAQLPRRAFNAVLSGLDDQDLEALYQEPLAALQDDDIQLSRNAEFAYYSVRNLFVAHVLRRATDPWLVINQALSAIGEDQAIIALEDAVRSVG